MALSFLVVALGVSVSAGFRKEIRSGVQAEVGDLRIVEYASTADIDTASIALPAALREAVLSVPGVASMEECVSRAGIVKAGETVHGILVKGIRGGAAKWAADSLAPLSVAVPRRLGSLLGLGVGDDLVTYFVGEKVRVRKFRIAALYPGILEMDDHLVVYADIEDMRRLNLWGPDRCSALDILLDSGVSSQERTEAVRERLQELLDSRSEEMEDYPYVSSSYERFPQLFSWLDLLDINVTVLLVLMGVVAGFNMISGLLIMLLRNIPTIGTLKTLGMRNAALSGAFLRCAARTLLRGLLLGNVVAIAFCLIQDATHLLTLNPAHYFVSFVPVAFDWGYLLLANAAAFGIALVMVALPLLMIARIDPAETVRGNLR